MRLSLPTLSAIPLADEYDDDGGADFGGGYDDYSDDEGGAAVGSEQPAGGDVDQVRPPGRGAPQPQLRWLAWACM